MTARPRRIGIDARLGAYRAAGIAEHVSRLAEGLADLGEPERIVVFAHRKARGTSWPLPSRTLLTPPHHVLEWLAVPVELALSRAGLDLWHAPDVVVPRMWRGASVATVHDVAFLRRPDLLTADSRRYYLGVHRSVRQADRVIVVSEHTRRELEALTAVDPARVRVVPNAVHPRFLEPAPEREDADRAVRARHGLPAAYLLFVGTIEPRKNLSAVLTAYRRLLDEGREIGLVLAGADGWHSAPVYDEARRLGLAGRARFLGHVPGADLPALYRGAAALVHPALDEGFGMTPLEAMACGTPTVVSDAGSLPEVVGDAALRLAPTDPAAWSAAVTRLLDDPALRRSLVAAGRTRAAEYTTQRQARATLEVYREVAAARGARMGGSDRPSVPGRR